VGFIDKLFSRFAVNAVVPVENIKKVAYRDNKVDANYSGGYSNYSTLGGKSGGAKWDYGLSSSGASHTIDHYKMRQNARDLFHDSLDARGIIERMADSVVDTGLVLECKPDHKTLGLDPEKAEEWSADVERRFHLYANDKKQHRAGNMNLYQMQRLYEIAQQRDNDIFMRFYYSQSRKLQNPLQFGMIDPNQIRATAFTSTWSQFGYDDGIIKNADGSEKAYKVWLSDPAKPGSYKNLEIPRIGAKSGRTMMIHGFNPEYAGQTRGYARLGFAIQEMENLTDFTSASIKKAINQSNLVLSVENQQKDPEQSFDELVSSSQNALGTVNTSAALSQESEEIIDRLALSCNHLPEATLDTPGSTLVVGNGQGDTIKMLGNSAPADDFKSFIEVFTERLAAAVSIPQEVVLMKFGQNYSASRATLLLFWKVVEMWRLEMAVDFLNPLFESWLTEEIAAGRISAPGWNDPVLKQAWLNCGWIGAPLPSIDPGKEAKARKDNLEMNLTTLEREARNLNGSDAKTNIEKNKKMFKEIAPVPWSNRPSDNLETEDKEDDDNE
jgi:lambda family phage portal protein